ncbi:4Fe-4S binding protein [Clostridium sp. 'deep sea']|uniref:4Fe-4S dicluster domain-containing protein n=1 Tax=Clostridium sp. 'deep sea' TaxID=2779445 RepID=UPI001896896E|nr:4Fe-4S dicluster domain-containing protein [Clostridium sp. 'deep sea']QOR34089.1 4Fe-4S binding protein [Clostridium sp. 'deep sea']
MLKHTGVATPEDIKGVTPSEERLSKGPIAIIECFQKIPCNPCSMACPREGIKKMEDINERPVIVPENCNGCGICVSRCPGLAIFVVDATYSEKEALVKLPWELLPLPKKGAIVKTLNRAGEPVGKAKVVNIQDGKFFDRTRIIHLAVPKAEMMEVRSIDRGSF